MRAKTKTYLGRPCRKCGGTERWESNCSCIACQKVYQQGVDKDTARGYYKKYRAQPKKRRLSFDGNILREYGLTREFFDKMLIESCGRCSICAEQFEDTTTQPCIDHDHDTKEIRGLLCNTCNRAIGFLHDSPILCLDACKYLAGVNNATS